MASAADRPPQKKSSTSKLVLVLLIVIVLMAGMAAAGWFFLARQQGTAAALPAPAAYVPLPPAFVVNLGETRSGPRYLQVEVDLVTRDPAAVETLKHHAPALRARLLMLFAQQTYEGLATREGKETLQAQALEEVRELMTAETGQPQAESLLFTSFVTQ